MAEEHTQNPPSPLSAAPPLTGITTNGQVRASDGHATSAPAVAPAPSVVHTLRELVWPSTGPHVQQTESVREVVETIVFVVVLVLLLKSFAAEAFVIPTGSMAETLWGYQKVVVCPKCKILFPVNCSQEVDPSDGGMRLTVTGGTCPNCRYHVDIRDAAWTSGDRVLVAKSLYESGLMHPERDDVVVFKYPQAPQKNHVPMNYIKRLIGLGGETIGIWYGKLYVMYGDEPDENDRKAPPHDLWKPQFMHENKFKEALENRDPRFQIIRKRPDKILALKRLVYKNDNPASDMADFPRWSGAGWNADNAHGFHHDANQGASPEWLRYSHLLRGSGERGGAPRPELITDFMGYNSWETDHGHSSPPPNWVGDLMLECDVTVDQPAGLLVLELAKGVDRFRARFELADGSCTLARVRDGVEQKLETKPTSLKQKGTYRVRLANVDDRLTVWVDSSLPFGDGVAYEAAAERGPRENDLQPANIGVQGAALGVHHLTLWRDTYYTLRPGDADATVSDWSDPSGWGELLHLPAKTLFVQPGHYLCLGDNSPESSDSRAWGTVPERLLLGRALLVYYPFYAPFWPLQSPVNRVGPIE